MINQEYLNLLQRQAMEELKFLQDAGHGSGENDQHCIFCKPYQQDNKLKHVCFRVEDISNFLKQILAHSHVIQSNKPDNA